MNPFLALITPLGVQPPTGPVDPGYSPPWAQVPPGGQGGGPVDPGYSPPWAHPRPPQGPVDPGYSPPWAQVPGGGGPVDPGYSPPWARPGGPVDPGYSPPWAQVPGASPVKQGVKESDIPSHPDKPTGQNGVWVLVSTGPNQVGWAWMETSTPTTPPTTPPDSSVGPAHPIQPTVPTPKK